MSTTTTEQILKLSGGGTFSELPPHISSLCPNNNYEIDKGMVDQSFKSKKDAVNRIAE